MGRDVPKELAECQDDWLRRWIHWLQTTLHFSASAVHYINYGCTIKAHQWTTIWFHSITADTALHCIALHASAVHCAGVLHCCTYSIQCTARRSVCLRRWYLNGVRFTNSHLHLMQLKGGFAVGSYRMCSYKRCNPQFVGDNLWWHKIHKLLIWRPII